MKSREERFFEKVSKTSRCWNWTGATGGSGYGQFWDGNRNMPAHWFLLESLPSKGKEACHHCDNKLCVRPSHIFIGTRSDNMRDCVAKGRLRFQAGIIAANGRRKTWHKGSANHASILSDADAAMVKATPKGYGMGVLLARYLGVSGTVISGIWSGKRWAHIIPDATAAQRSEALCRTLWPERFNK